jgi:hypothetical protein
MLRKMLILTVAVCAAILLASGDALAWGCGSWSRSGSVSYTGRYGNTYTRSYSGSGYHYGRWGGSITMAAATTAADFVREVSLPGMPPAPTIPSSISGGWRRL